MSEERNYNQAALDEVVHRLTQNGASSPDKDTLISDLVTEHQFTTLIKDWETELENYSDLIHGRFQYQGQTVEDMAEAWYSAQESY